MSIPLDADYVVFGAGAMGMAFVDTLITETKSTIVLVDAHAQPGGHWNDAYPYVRLHQPSAFYGVNSRKLERSSDLLELASRNEVLAYYEVVLESFLASGRVQYFPMCLSDDVNTRKFRSLVDPSKSYEVGSRAKIVDATYMRVMVPSVNKAAESGRYEVAEGVELVPLNELPKIGAARERYVILGAGKSGMDAVLWLLNNSVNADRITWIMPRDAWIVNRAVFSWMQRFDDSFDMVGVLREMPQATSVQDYYERMEKFDFWQRLDPTKPATRNKCATVSPAEIVQLRSVKDVVRMGRVSRVEPGRLLFVSGDSLSTGEDVLYIDCTSDALSRRAPVPVFQGDKITLQTLIVCQQVFSAAVIAHLEARGGSEAEKNSISAPAPHPDKPEDFITSTAIQARNMRAWKADSDMSRWLSKARLHSDTSTAQYVHKLKALRWGLTNLSGMFTLQGAEEAGLKTIEQIASKL